MRKNKLTIVFMGLMTVIFLMGCGDSCKDSDGCTDAQPEPTETVSPAPTPQPTVEPSPEPTPEPTPEDPDLGCELGEGGEVGTLVCHLNPNGVEKQLCLDEEAVEDHADHERDYLGQCNG